MTKGQAEDFGRHFDIRRTKDARGNVGTIRGNAVNLTMPAASTDFDTLMEISRSAQKPFPVKLLSEKLREKKYIRGRVFFGSVVKVIATILLDYPLLRWWIEQDGLVAG